MKKLLIAISIVLSIGIITFVAWNYTPVVREQPLAEAVELSLDEFETVIENEGDTIVYLTKYVYGGETYNSTIILTYDKQENKIKDRIEVPFFFAITDMQQGWIIGAWHNCDGCEDIGPADIILFNPTTKKWLNLGAVKDVEIRQIEEGGKIASFETYTASYQKCEDVDFCLNSSYLVHTPSGIREDRGLGY